MVGLVIGAFAAIGALLAWGVYAVMDINALPPLGAALLGGLFGALRNPRSSGEGTSPRT